MGLFDFLTKKVFGKETSQPRKTTNSQEAYEPVTEPTPVEQPKKTPVDLRTDWVPYFAEILETEFPDFEVRQSVSAHELMADAHPACKPIDFMLYQNGIPCTAIVLVRPNNYRGMNVVGTKRICDAKNIPYIRFFTTMPNERAYVIERIRSGIN